MVKYCEIQRNNRQVDRRTLRSGMTLVELVLVIAIMVVVAALASPSVQRSLARQALRSGADRVRVAMGQARVKAIRHGEEYAVFFMPDSGWFNVAPFVDYREQAEQAARAEQVLNSGIRNDFEDDMLPRGLRFAAAEAVVDARATAVMESSDNGGSVKAILFYPDGTSQDARVTVQNEVNAVIDVELRGLTGLAKTLPVTKRSSVK